MAGELKRRDFLKTSVAAAATAGPAVISARGQNNKINLGWIGMGTRGNAGVEWLKKAAPDDILIRITVVNRGPDRAPLHVLPTLWFRNTWAWGRTTPASCPRGRSCSSS